MINKDESKTKEATPEPGFKDVAKMDVQCHLLIKDKDTNEVLINKRG